MCKIFFSADTHFGSQRTLELSKRPFKNVETMNEEIVRLWNEIIGPNDKVYHLGDFGDYNFVKRLNGNISLKNNQPEIPLALADGMNDGE